MKTDFCTCVQIWLSFLCPLFLFPVKPWLQSSSSDLESAHSCSSMIKFSKRRSHLDCSKGTFPMFHKTQNFPRIIQNHFYTFKGEEHLEHWHKLTEILVECRCLLLPRMPDTKSLCWFFNFEITSNLAKMLICEFNARWPCLKNSDHKLYSSGSWLCSEVIKTSFGLLRKLAMSSLQMNFHLSNSSSPNICLFNSNVTYNT